MNLVPGNPAAVYLHVGPPKTGTTYLQDVLWRNQRALAERGVTVPGRQVDHFHAALDLRDLAFGGYEHPDVPGSWAKLVARANQAEGKVVISHEVLAGAQPEQIARAVADLAPAPVHVVYGVRDLGRQLSAVWQESLKNRQTRSFRRFLDRNLGPGAGTDRGFWRAQHPVAVLQRWAQHVPLDRISVVTLPTASAGTRGAVLWERFCAAVEVDPWGLDLTVARSNTSLSAAQSEVLRLLNKALAPELTWPEYERSVKARFNRLAEAGGGGGRVKVPVSLREEVTRRAEEIITGLEGAGYRVIGDLADLRPAAGSFGRAGAKPARVADAAVSLLAAELTGSKQPGHPDSVRGRARSLMGRIQGRGNA